MSDGFDIVMKVYLYFIRSKLKMRIFHDLLLKDFHRNDLINILNLLDETDITNFILINFGSEISIKNSWILNPVLRRTFFDDFEF